MDDIYALDGPRFMRMAWRISVYEGVISMRVREQQALAEPAVTESRQAPRATTKTSGARSSEKRLAASAATFPDVFDVRRAH